MPLEFSNKRKVDEIGEARVHDEKTYDSFQPTLAGFVPDNECVLLRELVLPDEGLIQRPDAYAEDCLFAQVIQSSPEFYPLKGCIVRILKGVGHTIPFVDAGEQRYFTVHRQDIIGHWNAA